MGYATRDTLGGTLKRRYRDCTPPAHLIRSLELPDEVTFRVQSLTDKERTEIEYYMVDDAGEVIGDRKYFAKARWVVKCLVDGEDLPLYTMDEVATVAAMDSALINWLVDEIYEHIGVTAKDVEDLEKNCSETEGQDCSPSVSPSASAA